MQLGSTSRGVPAACILGLKYIDYSVATPERHGCDIFNRLAQKRAAKCQQWLTRERLNIDRGAPIYTSYTGIIILLGCKRGPAADMGGFGGARRS